MATSKVEDTTIGWFFGLQWAAATVAGLVIGGMLALPVGYGLGEVVAGFLGEDVGGGVAGFVFGVLLGGGLGLGQWVLLRTRIAWGDWWAPASALTGAIGLAAAFPILIAMNAATEPGPLTELGIATFFSLPISLGQWLILRRQVDRAGWWIVLSGAALALGLTAGLQFDGEGREILAFAVSGLVMGAITGAGMVWLLRQPALRA